MYCLDCGTKLEDGAGSCPNCGLTVSEMQERLAAATEVLLYSDSVADAPDKTEKMPPVTQRSYVDKDGNPIDPKDPIDPQTLKPASALESIPRIGADDPFVTVPIKKVVDEYGAVIAGADTTPKLYRQNDSNKRKRKLMRVVVVLAVVLAAVVGCLLGYRWFSQVQADETQRQQEQQAQRAEEDARTQAREASLEAYQLLGNAYAQAGSFFEEQASATDTLMSDFARKLAVRQPAAQSVADLRMRIEDASNDLDCSFNELGLEQDSPYRAQFTHVQELYDLLLRRVDVIERCWDVSLSLSDVTGKTSEVLAPLAQDGGVGHSDAMTQFQEQYESAAPELVEP